MDVQKYLEQKKRDFENHCYEDRDDYFSSPSGYENFSQSQLFFFLYSRHYKLYHDGEFIRMCSDMQIYLGEKLFSEVMQNLCISRENKVKEIVANAPKFLMHVSNVSPAQMGDKIMPRNNLNQYGEKRGNFVFATENDIERDFYALRQNDEYGKNINWKKWANVNGTEKPVFILENINYESYTYFVSKQDFLPVVSLDGRFGHEWTSTKNVGYKYCERNNIEDIVRRNIVKIVDREKFSSQDDAFYKKLNNPNLIIGALNKSGVLKFHNMDKLIFEKLKGKEI